MKKYLGAYLVIVAAYLIYLVLRIYNGGAFDWFGDLSIPFFYFFCIGQYSLTKRKTKNKKTKKTHLYWWALRMCSVAVRLAPPLGLEPRTL